MKKRNYFDLREGDDIAPDEEGMELTIEAVQEEAPRALADMASWSESDSHFICGCLFIPHAEACVRPLHSDARGQGPWSAGMAPRDQARRLSANCSTWKA
jgi:ATP dependent DNA ligase-like protein/uncharacterized protein DUF6894